MSESIFVIGFTWENLSFCKGQGVILSLVLQVNFYIILYNKYELNLFFNYLFMVYENGLVHLGHIP